MNPTLIDSDLLEILPYGGRKIQLGDVIAFLPQMEYEIVIHRVIDLGEEGIRARGDRNTQWDPWLLQREEVVGRVLARWRGQKRSKVHGGLAGYFWSCLLSIIHKIDRALSPRLHALYRALSRKAKFAYLLPKKHRPKLLQFGGDGSYKVVMGSRMIGRYDAHRDLWRIQRPFRLIVDEEVLTEGIAAKHQRKDGSFRE